DGTHPHEAVADGQLLLAGPAVDVEHEAMAAALAGLDPPADLALAPHPDGPDRHVRGGRRPESHVGPGSVRAAVELQGDDGLLPDAQRPRLVPEGHLPQE